ncbi:hypothetical protein PDESU_03188 [Pontiella desulfatans]|uniref:Uncharacterized protein n=1 Tax=Pontiella desulfatans TaxID=2750659 RepID=A0A6C2U412_PONDE|nr:hypothetical protein PDESU_03188 [Pontiella desulfatans]
MFAYCFKQLRNSSFKYEMPCNMSHAKENSKR